MEITEPISNHPTGKEQTRIAEQAYFGDKSSNTKHQQRNNHTLDERNPAAVSKPWSASFPDLYDPRLTQRLSPKTPIDCTSDNSFEGAGNICKVGHTTTNQKHLEDVERPKHSQAKNTFVLINGRKCDMCWKCVCFKKTPTFEYVFSLHQKRVHLKWTHAIGPNFFHIIKSWDHERHEQIAIGISTFINSFWHLPFYQTSSPPFHEVQVMMSWHQG